MYLTEEEAAQLLDAAAEGEAAYRAALEELAPKLSAYVERLSNGSYSNLRARARLDAADVAQDLLIKLFRHPPPPITPGRAKRRLLAWLKVGTFRHLDDATNRGVKLVMGGSVDSDDASYPTEMPGYDPALAGSAYTEAVGTRELAARRQLASVREMIEACQPGCLGLFDLMLEGGELPSEELAAHLDTTRANVDTLKKRMRVTRRVWVELQANGEITLLEMAFRIDRPASDELGRTMRKVRNYLADQQSTRGART